MLPQKQRLAVLGINVLFLFILSKIALDSWMPPFSTRGLWFYSGAVAFLTGSLLDAPTHVTPKQVFGFSSVALIATLSAGLATDAPSFPVAIAAFALGTLILGATLIASCVAMWWKDASSAGASRLARTGVVVGKALGTPAVVWTVLFLFFLVSYHLTDKGEALVLLLGWMLLVLTRPVERAWTFLHALRVVWGRTPPASYLGVIVGHNVPGIVTIRHAGAANVQPGTPLVVRGDDGAPNVALALSYIGYSDGPWLRAIQLDVPAKMRRGLSVATLSEGACALLLDAQVLQALQDEPSGTISKRDNLIGLVISGSDRSTLRFEVLRFDSDLREGQLVSVRIGTRDVLYQILNGLTQDEIIQQKNTRGLVVASARKVGGWSEANMRFDHVPWVPAPNAAVFLERERHAPQVRGIGVFPGTDYPVEMTASSLVTHNTAVLGILGVGKTYAALELVERIIGSGARAICLDLTNQYASELAPYFDAQFHSEVSDKLRAIGEKGRTVVSKNVEEGGSIRQFSSAVHRLVRSFLRPDGERALLVLNPSSFEVWRQDSKPFQDTASMATLTAAEVTRIFSEAALAACQELGMTDVARCCLVYEEAHTLVPEFSAIAAEGDKAASNGSARAILQGRKFGLGCLVVTQRTASITKTILNQCNTIIAMRTYDATGMEFLANYIGKDYAGVLSALPDRHGVVFGKASSCSDPVVVRFNDRHAFLQTFRASQTVDRQQVPGTPLTVVDAP